MMNRSGRQGRSYTNPIAVGSGMAAVLVFVNTILVGAPHIPPVVDERWNVTVNGQTVRVNPDGTFRVSNISAADRFGATGPGSAPDFKSDEWFQAVGTATIDGVMWYAYSEPFQIMGDATGLPTTYHIQTFPVSLRPPSDIPESISIEVAAPLVLADDLRLERLLAGRDVAHAASAGPPCDTLGARRQTNPPILCHRFGGVIGRGGSRRSSPEALPAR